MEALRVGGLISGLDTNAIIDSLMANARIPIDRLNREMGFLALEREAYNAVITAITDLKDALLPLRLESTFKSKTSILSDSTIASVLASLEAVPGTYQVTVDQLASSGFAATNIPKPFIYGGANISDAKKSDAEDQINADNQLMGTHTVDIGYVDTNTVPPVERAMATDTFTAHDDRDFGKFLGGEMNAINEFGGYRANPPTTPSINGDINFKITVDGVEKNITVNLAGYGSAAKDQVQMIAKDIEDQLNAGLGTDQYDQKIAVKTEYDLTTKQFKLAFYNTDSENMDIEITGGDAGTLTGLGLPVSTPTTPSLTSKGRVTEMINHVIGRNMEVLTNKVLYEGGGIIPGFELELEDGETMLKEGSFTLYYEDTMNRKIATASQFLGNTFDKIQDAKPPLIGSDIDNWLSTSFKTSDESGDSYFDEKATKENLNGYFHINGVKIIIDDIETLTPNNLMAIINSSGAGVTASWDYENNFFKIESNIDGTKDITLGKDGDSSGILDFLKVSIPSGAIYLRGTDEGTIDTAAKISEAGFSTSPGATRGMFSINGVSIYIDINKDSVDDILRKVNSSAANVTMSYDSTTDKFRLDSKDGVGQIQIGSEKDTSNFLEMIGLSSDFRVPTSVGVSGQKSIFTIDGIRYERDTNEIEDIILGVEMTLTAEGNTTITIEIDPSRAIDAMAEFASSYNKLMMLVSPIPIDSDMKNEYWEPLTADKQATMSENEIKIYNENHKEIRMSETLRRSGEIRNIKQNIRTNLMDNTTTFGSINNMADLGLNIAGTGDISLTSQGLFIDTTTDVDKLKAKITDGAQFAAMIKKNPDEVFNFFNANVESEDGVIIEKGWSNRYDNWATTNSNTSSVLYKKAGVNGTIDNAMYRFQKDIETQTRRSEQYLERIWAQFTAMELRMAQIQSQSNALAQIGAR